MDLRERIESMDVQEKSRIKENIERVLSEILSDRYEAKITIKFEKPKEETCCDHR